MNVELHIFDYLPSNIQHEIAHLVSDYTNGKLGETPQMLPLEPQTVKEKHLGVVAFQNAAFVGFIGATQPEQHNGMTMPEVGSLWVPAEHRKKGIAHALISVISTVLDTQGKTPYAFCNPLSKGIFEQSGYKSSLPETIPPLAFGACSACPAKPGSGGCCDKVLLFTGGNK